MIKKIELSNFTAFASAKVNVAHGLNVIVGENGTGKSHLLKLAYILNNVFIKQQETKTRETLERTIAEKLVTVFRPDTLGRLATRVQGRSRCEVRAVCKRGSVIDFSFATNSSTKVSVDRVEFGRPEMPALFIPPKEVLSIYPGFAALYRNRSLEFDETYADLCDSLDMPPLRGPRLENIAQLLAPFEEVLGGTMMQEQGSFYFKGRRSKLEVPLLAEGHRKLGLLAYLILNGSLVDNGMLLWDEPESNLNARLIREVAGFLCLLARSRIQIMIATHSMFLLRELDIKAREDGLPLRCTALILDQDGLVTVQQSENMEDLPHIVALEEEANQADRYLASLES